MSDAALHTDRPARHVRLDDAATTQRWAIGVLALSTGLLLAYATLLVAPGWLSAIGWNVGAAGHAASVDALAVGADLAPALLVSWCTGLAASAVLTRGPALGARTAGVAAGAIGTAAGATLLALTGLL